MKEYFDVGDRVRPKATFWLNGVLTDGTVAGRVKDPSGNISVLSVTQLATGQYYADIDIDEVGLWHVEFTATGAVKAAVRGQFVVRPNVFG